MHNIVGSLQILSPTKDPCWQQQSFFIRPTPQSFLIVKFVSMQLIATRHKLHNTTVTVQHFTCQEHTHYPHTSPDALVVYRILRRHRAGPGSSMGSVIKCTAKVLITSPSSTYSTLMDFSSRRWEEQLGGRRRSEQKAAKNNHSQEMSWCHWLQISNKKIEPIRSSKLFSKNIKNVNDVSLQDLKSDNFQRACG